MGCHDQSSLCFVADNTVDVAAEIIDVLVATGKHEVLLLSRKVCENCASVVQTAYSDFNAGGFH